MKYILLILILGLLSWKGYYAWLRGRRTWLSEQQQYGSLREYLLGNGLSPREVHRPFFFRALRRAVVPLAVQWRFWLVIAVLLVPLLCMSITPEIPDYTAVRTTQKQAVKPLRRYAYRSWYSEQHRVPLAVAWYLTKEHTSGPNDRKHSNFHPDEEVKNPVTTFDYMQTGYDRGHMCPAGDNKWNQQALDETFLMTNICPQNHLLNKNDWNDLEQLCRQWARRYGRIYVVCGPILRGSQHKQIGPRSRRITVPEAFYKVVLRTGKNAAAIGFVFDNKGQRQSISQAVRSVDEIERLTGLDFFYALDDATEQRIEAKGNWNDWK